MKNIPKAILSRLMKLALTMLAVVLFGVIYGLIAHDRLLLLLTAVLDVSGTRLSRILWGFFYFTSFELYELFQGVLWGFVLLVTI